MLEVAWDEESRESDAVEESGEVENDDSRSGKDRWTGDVGCVGAKSWCCGCWEGRWLCVVLAGSLALVCGFGVAGVVSQGVLGLGDVAG
jgi:hypothetical protein